jgi:hypothetical protein
MNKDALQRKYSWGPIPDWELAQIEPEKKDPPRKRGRPPKVKTEEANLWPPSKS